MMNKYLKEIIRFLLSLLIIFILSIELREIILLLFQYDPCTEFIASYDSPIYIISRYQWYFLIYIFVLFLFLGAYCFIFGGCSFSRFCIDLPTILYETLISCIYAFIITRFSYWGDIPTSSEIGIYLLLIPVVFSWKRQESQAGYLKLIVLTVMNAVILFRGYYSFIFGGILTLLSLGTIWIAYYTALALKVLILLMSESLAFLYDEDDYDE